MKYDWPMGRFDVVAPIFLAIAAGYAVGKWRALPSKPFVTAVMDIFLPMLILEALWTAPIRREDVFIVPAAAAAVVLALLAACFALRPLIGIAVREYVLPVLLINSGFIGIAVATLSGKAEAVVMTVLYDQTQTLLAFTVGVWAVTGNTRLGQGLKTMAAEPLIWAIVLGAALRLANVPPHPLILTGVHYLGLPAPAVALFSVGVRLSHTAWQVSRPLVWVVALRIIGGYAAGLLAVALLGAEGTTAAVIIMVSALPSAVISYILAERYDAGADLAAASVFWSTLLMLPLIDPLLRLSGLI